MTTKKCLPTLPNVLWGGGKITPTEEPLLYPLFQQLRDPQPSLRHLQDLALFRRGPLQTLNHQPAALVVLDVSADLARHTGIPKEIKVIILGGGGCRKGGMKRHQGREGGKLEPFLCQCLMPSYLNLKELSHLQQDLLGIGMLLLPINARLQ